MGNWLKAHKILAAVALFLAALEVLFVFFVLLPLQEEMEDVHSDVESKFAQLKDHKWPMDGQKLQAYLNELQSSLDGKGKGKGASRSVREISQEALNKASGTFKGLLTQNYGSVADFLRGVSRLDYQAEYVRITKELKERGVTLSPSTLHLGEDVNTPYIYQSVMQLWTVERLVLLALDNGLAFAPAPNLRNAAAAVMVQPVCAWFETSQQTVPYLVEFPIRLVVEGTLENCEKFLDGLQEGENFLPVRRFEVQSVPPQLQGDSSEKLLPCKIRMTLECSSFLALGEN
ncbi:MAG: hypothetical protein IJJ26_11145 [Victivallales bacterium]|nr:hypothetical protein [Victivallales bacterium]